jgi:hypothetical protein
VADVIPKRQRAPMTDARKARFVQALKECGGLMRVAAKVASPHCTGRDGGYTSIRRAMAADPEFAAAVEDAREEGVAAMEAEIVDLIRSGWVEQTTETNGRTTTRIKRSERLMELYLRCKAGWEDRQRVDVNATVQRGPDLRIEELSDEELDKLEAAVAALQGAQERS